MHAAVVLLIIDQIKMKKNNKKMHMNQNVRKNGLFEERRTEKLN